MRAYISAVIVIAALHIYYCMSKGISPLSWELLVLIITPFLFTIWKDIDKFAFGPKGFEYERIKNDVNASIKQITHGGAIDSKSLDSIFKSVEINEWATLVLSRMLMRKGLRALVSSDHISGKPPSIRDLIDLCHAEGIISEQEASDLEKLRDITNYAEWESGNVPSYGDWQWALSNCKNIVSSIFAKQPIVR